MKHTIFLSYPSEQSELATRIELSLKGDGHAVFRDRSALPPGESFDGRIRAAIEESDLLIFLISREAVSQGRYTLTELKFAEQKWGHPAGHVLPVLIEPVPKEAIPAFLRAVTMLQPRGNVTAEVAAEVARMTAPWWRRMLEPRRLVPTAVVVLILVGGAWLGLPSYLERREQNSHAAVLVKQGRSEVESGNYASAWNFLEQASAAAPGSSDVLKAQETLAMEWLRRFPPKRVVGGRVNYQPFLDKVAPVLSRGAAGAKGEHRADLLAHLGWVDYLRELDGVGGDPAQHYRRALEVDPGNVYAHGMLGFEILRHRGSLAEAKQHFSAALESRREREYLRHLQISALLRIEDPEWKDEALRIANEMRSNGERKDKLRELGSDTGKLWSIYYFSILSDRKVPQFAALSPADHLATFRWLFPEDELEGWEKFLFLFVLAQLQEHSGDRTSALASYRRLLDEAANKGFDSSQATRIVKEANAAIKRLSS